MMPALLFLSLLCGPAHGGQTIGGTLPPLELGDGAPRIPTAEVPRGTLHQIDVEGQGIGDDRTAYVWVPEGPGPFPVVFAIHGGRNRDGRDMVPKLAEAQRRGVMVVYPNAGTIGGGNLWVGPDKAEEQQTDEPADRDVRYARALLRTLETAGYPMQVERMYVTGMSGGGYMTNLLWCEMSDTFAGFAVVSRAMPVTMSKTCRVARPRPYLLMMGTADDGLVNAYQLSFDDTRAFVRSQLRCPDEPVERRTLPDKGDPLEVRHTRWDCAEGVAFHDYEIEGGGHAWPGVGKPKADKTVDVDATEVILQSFGL